MTASVPPVFDEIATIRAAVDEHRLAGRSIALVPTMGALHAGHLALVERARNIADVVVVSIFVNPLQFAPSEDLEKYPRTIDTDLRMLARLADVVFHPDPDQLYPDGPPTVRVSAGDAGMRYEGAARPGHFDGMLTVVVKLLNIVQPQFVVFGRKDAQQLHLVRSTVHDLDLPVVVEDVRTVRDEDGLALSSRNRYLDEPARASALQLSGALVDAATAAADGVEAAVALARERVESDAAVKLDYLVAVDPVTFLPVDGDFHGTALLLIAARVAGMRLIDNAEIVFP